MDVEILLFTRTAKPPPPSIYPENGDTAYTYDRSINYLQVRESPYRQA